VSELLRAAQALVEASNGNADGRTRLAMRNYAELVTFAPVDEILDMLEVVFAEDWMAMPPWARNLAYRLAVLQRPDDAALLREAAADLFSFGPDWDPHAERLEEQAARLEESN